MSKEPVKEFVEAIKNNDVNAAREHLERILRMKAANRIRKVLSK